MNFRAKANSMKARMTLRVFIQPPDFGSFCNMLGKSAKMVKGTAIPSEKPNMPMMGFTKEPPAAFRATAPAMGSVQENETSTRVSAMKKMPATLPALCRLAEPFTHELGKVISK